MTARISLALALHNHQPVGNFGWVIAEVFEQAYLPMVDALERHPTVRVALHYSGPLLDWLRAERPEFIERLRVLADRGQVEIMGGGYAEPILVSLPERDRVGQLRRMADEVEEAVRDAADAARGWRSGSGSRTCRRRSWPGATAWTILDDAHFRAAAIPEDDLWGPYITEDQGRPITVFGTEQGLRYRIPLRTVEDVIELPARARHRGRVAGRDDGRRRREVRGVADDLGALLGRRATGSSGSSGARGERRLADDRDPERLAGRAPADRPRLRADRLVRGDGRVGAAAPRESAAFADGAARARRPGIAGGCAGCAARSGATSRSSTARSTTSTSRCSACPRRSRRWPPGPARDRAVDHLYQGQSNDCYWHGLFGGIYISHMRLATHEHLIAAEDLADRARGRARGGRDAGPRPRRRREVRLATAGQVVTVDLDEGAGIGDWDIRAARHAVTAVLRRAARGYHATLRAHEATSTRGRAGARAARRGLRSTTACARRRRASRTTSSTTRTSGGPGWSGSCRPDVTADDWANARTEDLADAVDGAFELAELGPDAARRRAARPTVAGDGPASASTKSIALGGGRLDPTLTVDGRGRERRATRRSTPGSASSGRPRCSAAAGTRRPGGRSPASAAAHDGTGSADGGHGARPGERLHRDRDRDDGLRARDGLVGAGRDDLELGGRLRARLPGQRAAAVVAAGLEPGGRWSASVGERRDRRPRSRGRGVSRPRLVVHGHFYQPSRLDPVTGTVPPDPTAAPARDWNARIAADCYRPNAELGNSGGSRGISVRRSPAGSQDGDPVAYRGFVEAMAAANGMAQPFHHTILPLATAADRRTEIRWGLRDFEWRFGRPAGRRLAARDRGGPRDARGCSSTRA